MIAPEERNVIEITKDDLQRMRQSPRRDHRSKFMKEKLELKALSDERAKRWPNTIKALHAKRIQDKKDKEANLERERLKLDALEATIRAERRNEMIKRANMMLFLPHITNVLSKQHTKNVAEEREAQIQYKQSIKEAWNRQERKWLKSQQEELEKWQKLEEIKAEEKKESVKALARDRLLQLKEHEERLSEKKRKKEDERKHLKQLQEEDRVLYEEKDKLKLQRIKEANEEMVKANEAQKARKQEEKLRLKQLDKDNEAYLERKEKIMEEKKQQEALKLLAKSKQREAISAKLYKQLLASKVDTEKSLERDQNKKKEEYDQQEATRIQRSKESLEACDKSRRMQIKWKHEQAVRDAAEEKYEVERSLECVSKCNMEAQDEERQRFLKNKLFANHQQKIMADNKRKALEEALEEKEEERSALQRMEDNDISGISLEDIKL